MDAQAQTKPLGCSHVSSNHSSDRVTVHAGRTEPVTLCGYHATYFLPESLKGE